jgi:AcrR family transcriptional regulator
MNRTRAALLDGARRAVEVSGTKITMAQVAAAAGVAKATLYNHFRTREAVLEALLLDEVSALAERAHGQALPEALVAVAEALSDHPLLAKLARAEPGTIAALGRIDRRAEGWRIAAAAVDELLAADGRTGRGLVLRWLASFVVSPAGSDAVAEDVAALVAALPGRSETAATA